MKQYIGELFSPPEFALSPISFANQFTVRPNNLFACCRISWPTISRLRQLLFLSPSSEFIGRGKCEVDTIYCAHYMKYSNTNMANMNTFYRSIITQMEEGMPL